MKTVVMVDVIGVNMMQMSNYELVETQDRTTYMVEN